MNEPRISTTPKRRVVLAYSGGLDTTVAIPWIAEQFHAEVVALTVDVGQEGELAGASDRALRNGAVEAHVIDGTKSFATEFLGPALQANALYQGVYPLSTALARPLIARTLVEEARARGADTVAHGCTGKGNDQVRFDVAIHTLGPGLQIIAPVREWNMNRDAEVAYAREHGLELRTGPGSPFSVDENLWGRSIEGGRLEDPASAPPEAAFEWTGHPDGWPVGAEEVRIAFEGGLPTHVDGARLGLVPLIRSLNVRAGAHGVGRIDHVEDRVVGIKSRETYECPAAVTLIEAHRALERLVLPRDLLTFKSEVERRFADLVYDGLWFSPLREALQAFVASTQWAVTGEVTVRWHQGRAIVVARDSEYSLMRPELTTYGAGSRFPQELAVGFIHLYGLPNQIAYARRPPPRVPAHGTDDVARAVLPAS
jgi:argininosuccinate synthase